MINKAFQKKKKKSLVSLMGKQVLREKKMNGLFWRTLSVFPAGKQGPPVSGVRGNENIALACNGGDCQHLNGRSPAQ